MHTTPCHRGNCFVCRERMDLEPVGGDRFVIPRHVRLSGADCSGSGSWPFRHHELVRDPNDPGGKIWKEAPDFAELPSNGIGK